MPELRPLSAWDGPPGDLTLWAPSPATLDAVGRAPVSPVPPSYEQEQHLRGYRACTDRGEEMARLLVVTWDEPGTCDVRAMTHCIDAHLRRHDTYHGWFAVEDDRIVRHVVADPSVLRVAPVALGTAGPEEWRRRATEVPGPFAWDCFRFGIVQRPTGFTFFASVDHVVMDSSLVVTLLEEIQRGYRALVDGEAPPRQAPAGSYLAYARAQRDRSATLTLDTPEVAAWVDFLRRQGGRMPAFPLPLGALEDRVLAEWLVADILDGADADRFVAASRGAGVRALGGVFACAALAEQTLAGTTRYGVVTPTTTRGSEQGARTAGWCMGIVPVDMATEGRDFAELARAAQAAFDGRIGLARVPIERVMELAAGLPGIRPVATGGVMLSYVDADLPPFDPAAAHAWAASSGRVYINRGMAAQVGLWVGRSATGITLTAAFPADPIARGSMARYVAAFRDACRRVARG